MPASFFNCSSMEGEAAFTFTVNPLASRCFTQLPQHSQVVDFQTSMTGERESALAARGGDAKRANERAKKEAISSYCKVPHMWDRTRSGRLIIAQSR